MKKRIWIILVTVCIICVCLGACSSNKEVKKIPEHGHFDTGYLPFIAGFEDTEIKYAKVSANMKNGEYVELNDDISYNVLTVEQESEFESYFQETAMAYYCDLCETTYKYDYVIVISSLKEDVFAVNLEEKKLYWIKNDSENNKATIYDDTLNDEQMNFLKGLFE